MGSCLSEKFYCIANEHEHKAGCSSSDAMSIYEETDGSGVSYNAYCFSCCQSFTKEELANSSVGKQLGLSDSPNVRLDIPKAPKSVPMTLDEVKDFIKEIGYVSHNYRGIKDEYSKFFGHLTKLDSSGNVLARYYPETEKGIVTGYKCRNHPKNFNYGKRGKVGITSDLSGQAKFKGGGKYILVTAGEEDKAAAFQMLREDQLRRGQGDFAPIAVVSSTTGEGGTARQCAAQYDFLDEYENIVICMDNDKAGEEALKETCKVLPAEKIKILRLSGGDPNKMLYDGKDKQFVREFYNAKPFIEDGIISSVEADTSIEEELGRPKITLPDFMYELEDRFAGGIPLGYWVNFIAMTGAGKSTTVNEAIRHWLYNSPYKVGIISLELTAPQYMIAMLSREVGHKINLIKSPEDALEFIARPDVQEARVRLREDEYGQERFALLDDREGTLEHVRSQIEKLIRKHGCKLIVIDPLNDLMDGSTWEEQTVFVKWMKNTLKSGITFACVCHVKKTLAATTDKTGKRILRELTEDDVSGLSLITKSAGANIFINRDKYAVDEIERNTTTVTIGKCRWTGITGPGGKWFYDNKTHTMYDFKQYFSHLPNSNTEEIPPVIENVPYEEPEDYVETQF